MMRIPATLTLIAVLSAAPAAAQDDCDVRREITRELDAAELDGVLIAAEAGSLDVTGGDVDRITVRAVVCADDERSVEESRLVVERRRDAAWVEADLPDGGRWGDYVRMDLEVRMPRGLAADIDDGSGSVTVTDIAALRLDDGSGSILVERVPGAVLVDDGSGALALRSVGPVEVDDGSGSIEIADVTGDVLILEDGSGSIEISDVSGSVHIREDGSGSISVARIGGDFVLDADGSGSVRYRDVQGRVSLPPDY